MTKTEWDGMELRDKNVLVAEKVMGWIRLEEPVVGLFYWAVGHSANRDYEWRDADGDLNNPDLTRFTTDRNACALVLDEIERRGDNVIFRFLNIFRMWCDITVAGTDHRQAAWFGMRADADLLCCCAVKAVEDG